MQHDIAAARGRGSYGRPDGTIIEYSSAV